jgi:hypothetical protein
MRLRDNLSAKNKGNLDLQATLNTQKAAAQADFNTNNPKFVASQSPSTTAYNNSTAAYTTYVSAINAYPSSCMLMRIGAFKSQVRLFQTYAGGFLIDANGLPVGYDLRC